MPDYAYDFARFPSCLWLPGTPQAELPLLRPCHTADIPFVLGILDRLPHPNGTCEFSNADKAYSAEISGLWTAMAAKGTPSETWPRYGAQAQNGVTFGNATVPGPIDFSECELWDDLNALTLDGTFGGEPNGTMTGTGLGGTPPAPTASIPVTTTDGVGMAAPLHLATLSLITTLVAGALLL